jgi:hypothetical protein
MCVVQSEHPMQYLGTPQTVYVPIHLALQMVEQSFQPLCHLLKVSKSWDFL